MEREFENAAATKWPWKPPLRFTVARVEELK